MNKLRRGNGPHFYRTEQKVKITIRYLIFSPHTVALLRIREMKKWNREVKEMCHVRGKSGARVDQHHIILFTLPTHATGICIILPLNNHATSVSILLPMINHASGISIILPLIVSRKHPPTC